MCHPRKFRLQEISISMDEHGICTMAGQMMTSRIENGVDSMYHNVYIQLCIQVNAMCSVIHYTEMQYICEFHIPNTAPRPSMYNTTGNYALLLVYEVHLTSMASSSPEEVLSCWTESNRAAVSELLLIWAMKSIRATLVSVQNSGVCVCVCVCVCVKERETSGRVLQTAQTCL